MGKWFRLKLLIVIGLSSVPLSLSALDGYFLTAWKGMHIVPLDELNVPIIVKNAMLANQQQMDAKGYIESKDKDAEFLLNIHRQTKKSNEGWRGMKEIFHYPTIGNCAYSQTEFTSIELSKESVKYWINQQPTSILVEGNVRDGFLYQISWYEGKLMKSLECANKKYDRRVVMEMVGLAKRIGVESLHSALKIT